MLIPNLAGSCSVSAVLRQTLRRYERGCSAEQAPCAVTGAVDHDHPHACAFGWRRNHESPASERATRPEVGMWISRTRKVRWLADVRCAPLRPRRGSLVTPQIEV